MNNLPISTRALLEVWGPMALTLFGKLAYAVAIFLFGRWLAKRLRGVSHTLLRKAGVDEALAHFLAALVRYGVLIATVIAALEKLDIKTSSLLAVLASAGLAVGLALQGSLSNFAAGTMILLFRPFNKGDSVEMAGKAGTVEEIGIFTTKLITAENEYVIIPNAKITGDCITNRTARGTRRCEVEIGVGCGEDIARVMQTLQATAEGNAYALEDPAPSVYFDSFGHSSLNFKVRLYATAQNYAKALHDLRVGIFNDLNAAKIDMPYQHLVLHQQQT